MTRARTLADLGSASLATDAEATAAAEAAAGAVPTGRKNLLYNGAMQVAQRGDQTNVGEVNYAADRFRTRTYGGNGRFNVDTLVEDVPTGTGFVYSTKWTVATAATDTGTAGYSIEQIIEGYDTMRLAYGTASAKQVTLSFWVKVSEAGTYCTGLRQPDILHSIHKELTLPANTWTKVEETFDGLALPLSGLDASAKTNGAGLIIDVLVLGGQTSKTSSTVGAWEVGNYINTPNQTDWMATAGNTVYITGVQLEVGDTATDFEHKPYGVELAECQRYYINSTTDLTTAIWYALPGCFWVDAEDFASGGYVFPVTMRASPTVTLHVLGDTGVIKSTNSGGQVSKSVTSGFVSIYGIGSVFHGGGYNVGRPYKAMFTASAEL
jgi:hypothetical protein